ncbi:MULTISPECIES: type II toxin-antitoxin system VapC family toxin [unclassified Streptomyces]|uniref:type II toxin-antitoxin system VapC family toxin n=1 Tax=unclassified Streptomyces TaxID=2593676 RepID=UPI00278BC19B|nr:MULTISPECIES: PIN domain-containing protein [unclassified Streptomyces]
MLIVDTGPLVAFLNRNDPDHERCADLLESYDGELLVTPYVLTECCYLVGKYVGADAEINLIESVAGGDLTQVFPDGEDMARIVELMRRYRGFPLGIADASVIATAERLKATEVATLDHRHFRAVEPSHVAAFTLLP